MKSRKIYLLLSKNFFLPNTAFRYGISLRARNLGSVGNMSPSNNETSGSVIMKDFEYEIIGPKNLIHKRNLEIEACQKSFQLI